MTAYVVVVAIVVLLAARSRVIFAIGAPTLLYFLLSGIPLSIFVQRAFAGIDQYTLVAIPLFVLVGAILQGSGVLDDLMCVIIRSLRKIRWGLALANVLDSAAFSGVSGSAAADVATLGPISIPLMKRAGYPATYAAALTAASSIVGPIIPPSIVFIFYGALTNVSIADLLLAGLGPGLLLTAAFAVVVYLQRGRFAHVADAEAPEPTANNWIGFAGVVAIAAFIVLSIGTGLATPTESAGIAALAAVGLLAVRNGPQFFPLLKRQLASAGLLSIDVLLLIAVSNALAWILTIEGTSAAIAQLFQSVAHDQAMFFVLLVLVLLIVGLFLDTFPAIILSVPVVVPVATSLGIDPLQLGVVVVLSLMIGAVHPPVGVCLYMATRIAGAPIWKTFWEVIPFILATLVVIALICAFPVIATWMVYALR